MLLNVDCVQFKVLKLSRSELCAIMVEKNAAGMQIFSATVGQLGPVGSKPDQTG